ncbi:MAG: hypothetical protein U1F27_09945 [Turneriella sp.]
MKRLLIATILALPLLHCTGELPLSDLVNNTITLKVLGTYESNDPYGLFSTLQKDDVINAGIAGASPALSSTTDLFKYITTGTGPNYTDYANLVNRPSLVKYYIDIAEIRIAQGQGKSSSQSISDYWSQFAISRQLMCSSYDSADGRGLSNCSDSAGIDRLNEFFNGGFTYPAVDIASGNFNHLGIYFRRFATYPAARFRGDGSYSDGANNATDKATSENSMTTAFDNRTIYGIDIESFLQNAYGATNTEPMMFPLQRKDLSLNIYNDHEPYVLEVRMFIKNAMMVHVIQNTGTVTPAADPTNSAFVYVAPADWNVNHAYQDLSNSGRQGGAIAMTARTYQPSKVGAIKMSSAGTSGHYFAVVPAGTTFVTPVSVLPLAATAATNTTISNLQPGTYDVYRTCDKQACTSASTAGTCDNPQGGTDGYPETVVKCGSNVVVTTGTTTPVTTCTSDATTSTCP